MVSQLQATARQLGLEFGSRSHTYNSRLAQELGLWAEHAGHGREFHQAAFTAYFALGRNLADHRVLEELSLQAGLPVHEARKVLADRSWRAAVDRDWQEARQLAISAVPTLLLGDHRLVGAQNYQTLAALLDQNGIARRPGTTRNH